MKGLEIEVLESENQVVYKIQEIIRLILIGKGSKIAIELYNGEEFINSFNSFSVHPLSKMGKELTEVIPTNNGFDVAQCFREMERDYNLRKKTGFLKGNNTSQERNYTLLEMEELPNQEANNLVKNIVILKKVQDKEDIKVPIKIFYDPETQKLTRELLSFTPSLPNTALSPAAYNYYKTPEKLQNYLNQTSIQMNYKRDRKLRKKFVSFVDEIEYDIDCLASFATYFREVFHSYPYIQYYSTQWESGKTRALSCLIYASYHGEIWVNPTPAAMFRSIQDAKVIIGIDELNKLFYEDKRTKTMKCVIPELEAILTHGYKRGGSVPRINMETKPPTLERFKVFGLKAFTVLGANGIPLDLDSRSIKHTMIKKIHIDTLKSRDPLVEDFQEIRDCYFLWRLELVEKVAQVYMELLKHTPLKGRIGELYLPLLTMAKVLGNDALYNKVLEYAKLQEKNKLQEQDPIAEAILKVLILKTDENGSPLWGIYRNGVFIKGNRPRFKELRKLWIQELKDMEILSEDIEPKYYPRAVKKTKFLKDLGFRKSEYHPQKKVYMDIDVNILLQLIHSYFPETLEVIHCIDLFSFVITPQKSLVTQVTQVELVTLVIEGKEKKEGKGKNPQKKLDPPIAEVVSSDTSYNTPKEERPPIIRLPKGKDNSENVEEMNRLLAFIDSAFDKQEVIPKGDLVMCAEVEGFGKALSDHAITQLEQNDSLYQVRDKGLRRESRLTNKNITPEVTINGLKEIIRLYNTKGEGLSFEDFTVILKEAPESVLRKTLQEGINEGDFYQRKKGKYDIL
jgi:hypothetical protein